VKVHFEQTEQHLVDFNRYHWEHSATARWLRWLNYAGGPLVFGVVAYLMWRHGPVAVLAGATAGSIVYASFLWSYWRYAMPWLVRRLYAEGHGKGMYGPHEIEITPTGVLEKTIGNESRWTWASIERVTNDERYIYIYTQPLAAHTIPKAAFIGSDARQFLGEAQRYFADARRAGGDA
jgi:hypothetical protein